MLLDTTVISYAGKEKLDMKTPSKKTPKTQATLSRAPGTRGGEVIPVIEQTNRRRAPNGGNLKEFEGSLYVSRSIETRREQMQGANA